MQKIELLAPAGDLEKLKMAVLYGADAVYLAGKSFGMRAFAGNFGEEEMREGITFAHQHGAKVYVTVNIFANNQDIAELPPYLELLAALKVDALIIADPGVLAVVRQTVPSLPCHLSTQANTTNWRSAKFWEDAGFSRVVLARELTLAEITEISQQTNLELEVFVQGAMCWAYSGRCYLSQHLAGRSANRGECAQACRWKYNLVQERQPGEYMPIEEDERGIYILNARDLCLLDQLGELAQAGVNSFKIEGRMKSVYYVATVTRVYRQALDAYLADPENYTIDPAWHEELHKISHRPYTTGFIDGNPGESGQVFDSSAQVSSHEFVGVVRAYDEAAGRAVVEMRNRFAAGESLEVVGPHTSSREFTVSALKNSEDQPIAEAIRVQEHVSFSIPFPVEEYSLVRRQKT
ncbi:MAG TPA: U32 family peptidase [Oscillospiraceae bacterium]|nr:U32 family peptidase [Oscillospiraceae bacterium]